MSKRTILALALLGMLVLVPLAGCGGGGSEEQAATTEQAAGTTEAAAGSTEAAVATHDCAGGCGMTDVPEDQLTQIDGKWYCAGCAAKAAEEHGHDDHDGHTHDEG